MGCTPPQRPPHQPGQHARSCANHIRSLWEGGPTQAGPSVLKDELVHAPVLPGAIRKVAADRERDLLLAQLLHCNLQRVRLSAQLHHHRRVHAYLKRARPEHARLFILGHVACRDAWAVFRAARGARGVALQDVNRVLGVFDVDRILRFVKHSIVSAVKISATPVVLVSHVATSSKPQRRSRFGRPRLLAAAVRPSAQPAASPGAPRCPARWRRRRRRRLLPSKRALPDKWPAALAGQRRNE
mmetsp:Transcript_39047/g.116159  ORF Transcript_39047/g.116159 Transcript_39047/m.116159 type:complete len:242 (+) Transcript_39047:2-727(+)